MVEGIIEEGSFDIKLSVRPSLGNSKYKEKPEGFIVSDRYKEFFIINSFNLRVSICNKSGFIIYKIALDISFDSENPSTFNKLSVW